MCGNAIHLLIETKYPQLMDKSVRSTFSMNIVHIADSLNHLSPLIFNRMEKLYCENLI